MQITIRNLGILQKETTFHLKPLTIFIGPNNAGKTWLAYSLAGILGTYGTGEYTQAYTERQVTDAYEPLEQAIEKVLTEGSAIIDVRLFADGCGDAYFNNVAKYAQTWMSRYFATQLVKFDTMEIRIRLEEAKAQFLKRVSQDARRRNVVIGPKEPRLTIRKAPGDNRIYAYTYADTQDAEGQESIGEKISPEEVREHLVSFVTSMLRRSLYPQIRIFPTERTTFVAANIRKETIRLSSIDKETAEALEVLANKLPELTGQVGTPRPATGPIGSFMNMLSDLFNVGTRDQEEREKSANRDIRIRDYIRLAEVLEKEILAGKVYFSTPEPDPRREILFQPAEATDMEIQIASSMVKELSPLVLYLRYLAKPGELLVIDEPEMNLHPAAQVKIIEFLAMLVNAGLHVLITTHSTYVVDHLMNLMDAYKHENKDDIVEMFLLEQKEAFIAQEKVAVYHVDDEDGEIRNILDPEGIIHWQTFSDVTRLVERIHLEL